MRPASPRFLHWCGRPGCRPCCACTAPGLLRRQLNLCQQHAAGTGTQPRATQRSGSGRVGDTSHWLSPRSQDPEAMGKRQIQVLS